MLEIGCPGSLNRSLRRENAPPVACGSSGIPANMVSAPPGLTLNPFQSWMPASSVPLRAVSAGPVLNRVERGITIIGGKGQRASSVGALPSASGKGGPVDAASSGAGKGPAGGGSRGHSAVGPTAKRAKSNQSHSSGPVIFKTRIGPSQYVILASLELIPSRR